MRIRTNLLIVPLLILILFKAEFQALVVRIAQTHQTVQVADPNLKLEVKGKTIIYSGSINPQNAVALDVFTLLNPNTESISLNSGGGAVAAIDHYLTIIKENNLKVVVETGKKCMSACAAIAIAQYKTNNLILEEKAILGFHKIKVLADFRNVTPEETMRAQELMLANFYSTLSDYGFSVKMISKLIQETDESTLFYPESYNDLPEFLQGNKYKVTGIE